MERGGTITWYLTANDADFNATTRKVREEAKRTGSDVDRDFKKGFGGASLSLDDFNRSMGRSATSFRNFQIALRGFELTALIIGATIATGAIIELAGAVAALGGLLATVPAGIASVAGALSTIKVATFGVADSFKELTKKTAGLNAAQSLAKKQADLTESSMKKDEALTRRLDDLKEQYNDTLTALAEEGMRKLNEEIQEGVEAWNEITRAATSYLDVSASLDDMQLEVSQAQAAVAQATLNYGAASQQAAEANRELFAAQARLASSNAELDSQYGSIKDNIKDLATNLGSLQKANKNEIKATLATLKALELDKRIRGENTDEISRMIDVVEELEAIKDTKLDVNTDLAGAQADLDDLKSQFPDIAIAATEAATTTEKQLTRSLDNIADSMEDVRRERAELSAELKKSLSEASVAGAGQTDAFLNLSKNAQEFVKTLKELSEAFIPVRKAIQDKFFEGLDKEIRSVAEVTFPILERGLGNIASAMNGMAKEAARVVKEPFFTGAVATSLDTTAQSTSILTGAIEPLARVVTDLVNIGNPYVVMLSEWIVKQSELAAAFTGSVEGQTRLNEGIQLGLTALKQLGEFIGAVAGLLFDLFKVSNEAGVSLIGTLTEVINQMRDWIATAEGQEKLKALFEATDTVLRALFDVIGKVVDGLLGIVKAYNDLDQPAKDIITNILVFSAIATPVLTYVSGLFASLSTVIGVGREAMQAFGAAAKLVGVDVSGVGKIFSVVAKNPLLLILSALAAVFIYLGTQTTVFQDALKKLQPVFASFGKALGPFLDAIGKLAEQLGEALAPVIPVIAEAFGQILTALLPLIPALLQLVEALLPILVALLTALVEVIQFLMPILTVLIDVLSVVLVAAINIVVGILQVLINIITAVANAFVAAWKGIVAAWQGAAGFFKAIWDAIALTFSVVGEFFKQIFQGAWNFIVSVWQGAANFFSGIGNGISNIFNNVINAIRNAFNGAVNFVRGIPGSILGALGNLGYLLWNAGGDLIRGLVNGIGNASWAVVNKIKEICSGALNAVKSFFGIRSPSRVMADMGMYVMEGFEGGIDAMGDSVVGAAQNVADNVLGAFTGLATDVGAVQSDFSVNAGGAASLAPAVITPQTQDNFTGGSGVVINQTNTVNSEIDMDQVNRNLTWEMNKV